ncbi:APC family permease [Kineococcus sp. SYSU DK001]|uniref:APC family permease n=1 Tax=Kineococcus sp. SYSU DK001 TaxID=3383122 RepID=UPI003D7D5B51
MSPSPSQVPPPALPSTTLTANSLGVPGIVFLVLAAVAPLTGIIVIACLGIALGNGGGMTGSFVLVAAALLLFAVGYARMARETVHAGGFYAFVLKGLGRRAALVAAVTALLGYNLFVAGAVGTTGFFFGTVVEQLTGISVHWFAWSLVTVLLAAALTRRGVAFSARVLGVSLVLEVLVLVVFDVSVLLRTGFSPEVWSPATVVGPGLGLGLLFAANAFIGVEATGLFSEEARDPVRTVPRATYLAVGIIGVFAAVTVWAIVSATGVARAQQTAQDHLATGDLVFSLSRQYLGTALTDVMMLLLLVSLFAALMALHNSACRYLFSLGRVGVLPRTLGRVSSRGVPQRASTTQFAFATLVAAAFWVAGTDPITTLVPAMTGSGTLGILCLQVMAAAAVVVHFRRRGDRRWWSTAVAPGLGFCALSGIVVLAVANFPTMAGSDSPVVAALPWLYAAAALVAVVWGSLLRRRAPRVWAGLSQDLEADDVRETPVEPVR